MKIAYVMMDFPIKSETFACNDVRKLQEMGHSVDVYSLMAPTSEKAALLHSRFSNGVNVHYCKPGEIFDLRLHLKYLPYLIKHFTFTMTSKFDSQKARFKHIYYALPCLFHFEHHFKNNDYDIIHLFWGHYPMILAELLKKYGADHNLSVFLGAIDLSYRLPITKKLAPDLKTVFTHSFSNIDDLKRLDVTEGRVQVIHRGVDIDYLRSLPTIEKDKNLWVSSGRLVESKKFDEAIYFFSEALKQNSNLRLQVIGSGPSENSLKTIVNTMELEAYVEFIPWLPHRELLLKLAQADTLLFFSEKPGEKLPNIVKEAMFFKCLCLVGPKSGCDELITHGTHGLILTKGTSFSKVLDEYGADLFENMRNNARERIIKEFSLTNSMEKYVDRWQKISNKEETS